MLETTSLRETYLKAQTLAAGGDLAGARSALEDLLQLESFLALVRNDAAALCAAQGQTDQAIQHLEQAVRIDPTHQTAHANLAELYQHTGNTTRAVEMSRKALALSYRETANQPDRWPVAVSPAPVASPGPSTLTNTHARHFGRTMNLLLIAQAVAALARARTGRRALRLAYVGTTMALDVSEALGDFGLQNAGCFAGDPGDIFHPSRPISACSPQDFDVVFIGDRDPVRGQQLAAAFAAHAGTWTGPGPRPLAVEIDTLTAAHVAFLDDFRGSLDTCLNPHKLAIILIALALAPRDGCVVEAGVAGGGTTVFMAQMQRILNIVRPIYALDTFAGMPAPVDKDYGGGFVYTAGLFDQMSLARVQHNYQAHGVAGDIRIRPGLVQHTLPGVVRESPRIALMLLDTDQYSGTKGGLDEGLPHLAPGGMIIVDDAAIHGVDLAIEEARARVPHLMRANLSVNFDLVWLEPR